MTIGLAAQQRKRDADEEKDDGANQQVPGAVAIGKPQTLAVCNRMATRNQCGGHTREDRKHDGRATRHQKFNGRRNRNKRSNMRQEHADNCQSASSIKISNPARGARTLCDAGVAVEIVIAPISTDPGVIDRALTINFVVELALPSTIAAMQRRFFLAI